MGRRVKQTTQVQTPKCYGLLYKRSSQFCQCCLLQINCNSAMSRPKAVIGGSVESEQIPKDKKSLVLAVCAKYGISTTYKGRDGTITSVTPETAQGFSNLDFLLTTREALKTLLQAGEKHSNG